MNLLARCIRIEQGARSRLRNFWYRALGVDLPGYVWLRRISIPRQWTDIRLEPGVALDDGVVLLCSGAPRTGKLVIRSGTYVNRHTIFDAHQQVQIGRDCLIGPFCYLTDGAHGITGAEPPINQPISARPVILEDNVWLGAGVTVLCGVRIGQGAVVGAGAVVTRDVAAQAIVLGVPARFIRDRSTRPPA